ncbi:MAG: hypothetical protein RLZZ618_2015 [Pseudomonadota bacterium]
MTSKKNLVAALAAASLAALMLAPGAAVAQFKVPSFGGGGGNTSSGGDASAQQDQLVSAYVGADKEVLNAQSKMAEAVGLKERAASLNAASQALSQGATKDSLEASETMQSEAAQEIQAKLNDSNTKLDSAGKKKFSEALGALAKGIQKYSKLREPIQAFQAAVTGGGAAGMLTAATKLGAGKYIVTSTPGHVKNLTGTLSTAVAYAKNHDIPVPAEATSLL